MTPQQKTEALAWLERQAIVADNAWLPLTAKSWREYADMIRVRPAAEIVCCKYFKMEETQ